MEFWQSREFVIGVKIALLVLSLAIGLFSLLAKKERYRRFRTPVIVLLCFCALLAGASYFHFGKMVRGHFVNYHDQYHYYVGSKYFKEIGYLNLYNCSLIADSEGRNLAKKHKLTKIRSLANYNFIKTEEVLSHPEICHSKFSPERWEEFKRDIDFFRKQKPRSFKAKLKDKGYNATPSWNMLGHFISNNVPLSHDNLIRLGLIDIFLLLAGFIAIGFAFGPECGLFTFIVFCSLYSIFHCHTRGAFLRFDWLAAMLFALAFLKRGYYKSAGLAMAWATASRIFPAIFLFALGAKFLWAIFNRGRVDKAKYLKFFTAYAISLLFVLLACFSYYSDSNYLEQYKAKISGHDQRLATTRVGMKYLIVNDGEKGDYNFVKKYGRYDFPLINAHKLALFKSLRPAYIAGLLGLFLVLGFLSRKMEDFEAIVWGFPLMFYLTAPTFYYYAFFCFVPLALLASSYKKRSAVILVFFTVSMIADYAIYKNVSYNWHKHFLISVNYLALCSLALAAVLFSDEKVKELLKTLYSKCLASLRGMSRKTRLISFAIFFCLLLSGLGISLYSLLDDGADKFPAAKDDESRATLVVGGDINLGRGIQKSYDKHGFEYVAGELKPLLDSADLVFGNLECALTDSNEKRPKKGTPTFHIKGRPDMAKLLDELGVDVVSLANNHTMDYDCRGLEDTMAALDKTDVQYSGAGRNHKEAAKSIVAEANGIKIGFLNYSAVSRDVRAGKDNCGINHLWLNKKVLKKSHRRLRSEIHALRKKADLVFVTIHWGVNYAKSSKLWMTDFAEKAIEYGAHGVLGHHAHQFLGMDTHLGRPILYDMGNFLFDSMNRRWTNRQGHWKMEISKQGVESVEFIPYYFDRPKRRARKARYKERSETFGHMQELTQGNGAEVEIQDDRMFLVLE